MTMTYNFEEVVAWQLAHSFVLKVYRYTKLFPEDERFGLTSQFRPAAVSIEANIAEGYKKLGKNDKLRFFNISQGSIEECRDYILLSRDLGYIEPDVFDEMHDSLERASRCLMAYCEGVINNAAMKGNDGIV